MKRFLLATAVLLLAGSTALGQAPYVTLMPVAPAPAVTYYAYPPAPLVAPVVTLPPRYYVASPVVAPAPLAAASPYPMAGPPLVYGPRVVVHPKVYVAGQPIRNVLRAVTP
ncbi:MAG: hypothetical protein ABSG86_31655 [Thermoguttaceae bacterium]|jgi:hypothetical protein